MQEVAREEDRWIRCSLPPSEFPKLHTKSTTQVMEEGRMHYALPAGGVDSNGRELEAIAAHHEDAANEQGFTEVSKGCKRDHRQLVDDDYQTLGPTRAMQMRQNRIPVHDGTCYMGCC
jgi:hypothetical protein